MHPGPPGPEADAEPCAGAIIGGAAGGAAALAVVALAIVIPLRRRKRRREQVDWLIMQKQERFPSDTDVVDDPLPPLLDDPHKDGGSGRGGPFDDPDDLMMDHPMTNPYAAGATYPAGNQYYDHSYPYGPVSEYPTTNPEEYYSSMFGRSGGGGGGDGAGAGRGTYDDPFADQHHADGGIGAGSATSTTGPAAYDMHSYTASSEATLPTSSIPAHSTAPVAPQADTHNPYVGLV